MNTFDEIMKHCPYLKELIEKKISEEVTKAKEERDKEVVALKTTIDDLTTSFLMGGDMQ